MTMDILHYYGTVVRYIHVNDHKVIIGINSFRINYEFM